jgi:hypothetical protein
MPTKNRKKLRKDSKKMNELLKLLFKLKKDKKTLLKINNIIYKFILILNFFY